MKRNLVFINSFLSKSCRVIIISSIITMIFFTSSVFAYTFKTNQKIDLKKSNDVNSETILTIEQGQTIEVLNTVDNFSIVKYNDKTGFIETTLLNGDKVETKPPSVQSTYEVDVEAVPYDMKDIVYKEMYDLVKSKASVKGVEITSNDSKTQQTNTVLKTRASKVTFPTWEEAKKIVTLGKDIEVYDVLTGKIYYIRSFSNGNHADVETVTVKDTEIAFETFNKKWDWDVRPVWVTINGVTMASSINGMPHAEGVNNDNNMDGQICLHFLGSKTHNGNESFTKLHQDVAKEAYDYALEYRK